MKWNEIVGQEAAKSRIEFYVTGYKNGEPMPSIICCGPRGFGKTEIMESTAVMLKEASGGLKRAVEYNCASIKNLKQFWNSIIIPVINDKDVTLFLDEAHKLPDDVTNALLTMTNPNRDNRNSYTYEDFTVDIDAYRQTFLYATTEPHKVFPPLINRCRRIDLEDYKHTELATILKRNAPGVTFAPKLLNDTIAPTLRGSAREATLMAKEIKTYLAPLKRSNFMDEDWAKFKKQLGIAPLGLSPLEARVLHALYEHPDCSLTRLGAKLMMSAPAVRQDLELYLLKHSLMEISTGGRNLTPRGHEILKELKGEGK
jgi:Holliday junction resolvasome RuvABC ATP-dependent DNA helicase subunit